MAISPPGDIVMDVLRAGRSEPVRDLASPRNATEGSENASSFVTATLRPVGRTLDTESVRARLRSDPLGSVALKFEAMVLRQVLSSLLPAENATYGQGAGSQIWRGMMVDTLATQIAQAGGLGIAGTVAASIQRQ